MASRLARRSLVDGDVLPLGSVDLCTCGQFIKAH
jgi:hypothetical protein